MTDQQLGTNPIDDATANQRIAELRTVVPELPDDLSALTDVRLRETLTHTQFQTLVFACQRLVPNLSRDAFHRDVTWGDLVYWLANDQTESAVPPRPPRGSYASPGTTLRPLVESDIFPLYLTSLDPRNTHRWRWRGTTPSPEAFRHSLFNDGVLAQYMVVVDLDLTNEPIGAVTAYNYDLTARHCMIAAQRLVTSEDPARQGLMIEGTLVFVQYLFDHFNFNKVYFEVPEYNLTMFFGGAGALLVSEGDEPEHFWYGDRYWSKRTFALYRSTWEQVAPHFRGEWPPGHFDAIVL